MRQEVGRYGYNLWALDSSTIGHLGLYTDTSRRMAQITFYKEDFNLPDNSKIGDVVQLHLPISKMASFLDMLRNEDPVFFDFNETNKLGVLSTSKEPVGEGE